MSDRLTAEEQRFLLKQYSLFKKERFENPIQSHEVGMAKRMIERGYLEKFNGECSVHDFCVWFTDAGLAKANELRGAECPDRM